jgi:glc operon protein GlcG
MRRVHMHKISLRAGCRAAMVTVSLLVAGVLELQSASAADPVTPPRPIPPFNYGIPIDIERAQQLAAAVEAAAKSRGVAATVAIVIVDTGGDIVYAQRATGANVAAMDVALAKARSAAFYGTATKGFYDALKRGDFKDSLSLPAAASMGPGGLPILVGGLITGAIGVTGAGDADEEVAEAGQTQRATSESAVPKDAIPAPPPVQYGIPISLEQAKRVVAAADIEARKRGIASFTLVITDPDGELVYAQKALGARRAVLEIAREKARAAARYGVSSALLTDNLLAGKLAESLALPEAATMGAGGVPIIAKGRIIGAVAVAGVYDANDHAIAEAGAAAVAGDPQLRQ